MKETKIEKLILDLSNRWECTPQEAVDRLNSMNESEIDKLINPMTKKFKNGGFIDCLRDGGSIHQCKCGKKVMPEKAFFGTKLNSYTPEQIKAIKNGVYRHSYVDDQGNQHTVRPWSRVMNGPSNSFGLARQVVTPQGNVLYRSQGYDIEKDGTVVPFGGEEGTEWYKDGNHKEAFENSKHYYPTMRETIKSIPPMMQEGGRVLGSEQYPYATRKDAIDAVMDQMGFSRAQARTAYINQKNALRGQGLRGKELRQHARYNMIDTAYPRAEENESTIEAIPTGPKINMPSHTLVAKSAGIIPIERSGRPDILTFGGSFDEAFNNARKMGLSEFAWQGGEYDRYHTRLDKSFTEGVRDKNQQRINARDNMVQSAIVQAKTAPKWYQRLGNAFMAGTLVNE